MGPVEICKTLDEIAQDCGDPVVWEAALLRGDIKDVMHLARLQLEAYQEASRVFCVFHNDDKVFIFAINSRHALMQVIRRTGEADGYYVCEKDPRYS